MDAPVYYPVYGVGELLRSSGVYVAGAEIEGGRDMRFALLVSATIIARALDGPSWSLWVVFFVSFLAVVFVIMDFAEYARRAWWESGVK